MQLVHPRGTQRVNCNCIVLLSPPIVIFHPPDNFGTFLGPQKLDMC